MQREKSKYNNKNEPYFMKNNAKNVRKNDSSGKNKGEEEEKSLPNLTSKGFSPPKKIFENVLGIPEMEIMMKVWHLSP